jgi:hypothetical protein
VVPWPYSFTSDLTVDQVMLKLRDQIGTYDGLAGSEADFETKSFWIKRNKYGLTRFRTQFVYQYYIMGSVKLKNNSTVVEGWVIPGFGAVVLFLALLVAGLRYGAVVINDQAQLHDWRVVALCIGYPVAMIFAAAIGINPEIKFLKSLIRSDEPLL